MNVRIQGPGEIAGNDGQRPRPALMSLSLSMLVPSLAISIANVALPTLERAFHAPFAQVQWVVLAYLLAVTATVVSVGRLGDAIGRRKLLLIGICLFTMSSLLCGIASSILWLIGARVAQGIGAAVMMALSTALVADLFPTARIGRAMGLLGGMSAIGTALGPSIGGFLIAGLGWRAVFFLNAASGLLAFVLAYRCLVVAPIEVAVRRPPFDLFGTVLLVAALTAYALAMTVGHAGSGPANFALLFIAAVGGALFFTVEGRVKAPLVPLHMLGNRVLRAGLAMNALVSTVMMATLVVGPFYLATSLGLRPALIGLSLSVGPAVAALAGTPAGRMVDRFGAARMTLVGLTTLAAAAIILTLTPMAFGVAGYVGPIAILTLGYAVFQAANNTLVMREPQANERGVVSGMLNLSRNLGLITGASVMGAVFARASAVESLTATSAEAAAFGMRATYAIAVLLSLVAIAISTRSARFPLREAI